MLGIVYSITLLACSLEEEDQNEEDQEEEEEQEEKGEEEEKGEGQEEQQEFEYVHRAIALHGCWHLHSHSIHRILFTFEHCMLPLPPPIPSGQQIILGMGCCFHHGISDFGA